MEKLTLPELRLICKEKGIKGYSKYKKAEMLELIMRESVDEKDIISFEGGQIHVNDTPINIILGNGMMPTHVISPENPEKVFDIIVALLDYVDETTQKDVINRLVNWKRGGDHVDCFGSSSVSCNSGVNIAGLLN